ncbi:MAG: isopenicillin N synthase family oxygenase [Rhodobacteraceae bacterium]|nr:isopenicillin N synthase family oxygenase [Paracoccaceae bacterium]
MFEIASVSYTDPGAPAAFARSLHDTGFAVLTDHPIGPERIEAAYDAWGAFFASEAKFQWTREEGGVAGYFPFRSENAKDAPVKDLKEFFHVYSNAPVPSELEAETRALYDDLVAVGLRLLEWLQDHAPADVAMALSEPLPQMLAGSEMNLLRVLHYPKLDEAPEPGAVRAAAHGDINLLTCLLSGSEPGLEAQDTTGRWHRVPCDPGMMAINAGDMLDAATRGHFPSTVHRVVNPPAAENKPRFSMPMFLHPRPEVMLKPDFSADDFLTLRLREIGLKS